MTYVLAEPTVDILQSLVSLAFQLAIFFLPFPPSFLSLFLSLCLSFFFIFGHQNMEFLGQGSDPSHSCDLIHSYGNPESLTTVRGQGSNLCPSAPKRPLVPLSHIGSASFPQTCNFQFPVSSPTKLNLAASSPTPVLPPDPQVLQLRILVVTHSFLVFCSPPSNSDSYKLPLKGILSSQPPCNPPFFPFPFLWTQLHCPANRALSSWIRPRSRRPLPKASCELCFKIFNHPSPPGGPDTKAPAWQSTRPHRMSHLSQLIIPFLTQ